MPSFDKFLKLERFEIRIENISQNPESAKIVLTGRIDIPNPSAEIGSFFEALDMYFAGAVSEVIVDALKLIHINSSGIKMLADWLVQVNESAPYKLILKLNSNLAWHNELLAPLRYLAPEKITIDLASDQI
jgi:hypothetical protein